MEVEKIFDYLDDFKGLPTYQLERRVDAFVLPYLESFFNKKFVTDDFKLVYVEFPLMPMLKENEILDSVSNRFICVDYLMWSSNLNHLYFVEFKTDSASSKPEQYKTYLLNLKQRWHEIMENYIRRFSNSIKKSGPWDKYYYGLKLLHTNAPELTGLAKDFQFKEFTRGKDSEVVGKYIKDLEIIKNLALIKKPELKLIYLGPEDCLDKTIGDLKGEYIELAKKYSPKLITLNEFSTCLKGKLKLLLESIERLEKEKSDREKDRIIKRKK